MAIPKSTEFTDEAGRKVHVSLDDVITRCGTIGPAKAATVVAVTADWHEHTTC